MFQGSKIFLVQFFLRLQAFSLHPRQARTLLVGGPPNMVFVRGLPGNCDRKLVQVTAAPPLLQLPRVFHRREPFPPTVQRVVDASGLFQEIPLVTVVVMGTDDEGAQGGNHLNTYLLHGFLEVHLEDVLRFVVDFKHLLGGNDC